MTHPTWKVMVYFAGQNHLAEDMVYSLKDMKSVKPDSSLTLLAEYSAKWLWKRQATKVDPPTPLRFHFKHHDKKWVMSDYVPPKEWERRKWRYIDELANFIKWGVSHEYKRSDRYMVILSGDGGGPVSTFLPSPIESHKKLKPFDLHRVFQAAWPYIKKKIGRKLDIVGLDSCLMSTGEIGYELRNYADFLVSSQGNADDIGWPYRDLLTWLNENPRSGPEDVVRKTVDTYNSYYVDYAMIAKSSGNLSGLRLEEFDPFGRALAQFVKAANANLPPENSKPPFKPKQQIFANLLVQAHWSAQTYRADQYTDLWDFCDLLVKEIHLLEKEAESQYGGKSASKKVSIFPEVVKACEKIKTNLCGLKNAPAVTGTPVVVKSCYVGAKYQYSQGLSIYFPWNRLNEAYAPYLRRERNMRPVRKPHSLAREAQWGEFLRRYLWASRRWVQDGYAPEDRDRSKLMRDPPEGRGERAECETAKNPTLQWNIAGCVVEPKKNL